MNKPYQSHNQELKFLKTGAEKSCQLQKLLSMSTAEPPRTGIIGVGMRVDRRMPPLVRICTLWQMFIIFITSPFFEEDESLTNLIWQSSTTYVDATMKMSLELGFASVSSWATAPPDSQEGKARTKANLKKHAQREYKNI